MEILKRIIELIDANLILCLIPIILVLSLLDKVFNQRFETKKALNIIRWGIIVYTAATFIVYLLEISFNPEESTFISRASGPYAILYWLLLLASLFLPFTLLIKKLGNRSWYLLFVAFGMKSGMYFERFVIITSSFQRDYQSLNGTTDFKESMLFSIGTLFMQGLIIAVLLLGVLELIKYKKRYRT